MKRALGTRVRVVSGPARCATETGRFLRYVLAAACFWGSTEPIGAQFSPGARSVGMGGAGHVHARGADALDWNPSNLALSGGWSATVIDVGAAGLVSGSTLGDLWDIWSSGGRGNSGVVDRLADAGLSVSTVMEGFSLGRVSSISGAPQTGFALPTVGVAYEHYGLRVRSRAFVEGRMSREIADLTVTGFDPAKLEEYRAGETGSGLASVTEVTASYGTTLGGRLAVGGGVRYVRGNLLSRSRLFEPEIDLNAETLLIRGGEVQSRGGSGYGLDLGLGIDLPKGIRVALSARNVVQNMEWHEALKAHEVVITGADFDDRDVEELINLFAEQPVDPGSVSLLTYLAGRELFFGSYFPTVITGGVGWRSGATTLELLGSWASRGGRFKSVWDDRVSLGAEHRLGPANVRIGFAKADEGVAAASAGLGVNLGRVVLDFGGGVLSGSSGGVDHAGAQAAFGVTIRGGGL